MAERYQQTSYQLGGTLQEIRQQLLDIQASDSIADAVRSNGGADIFNGCFLLFMGFFVFFLGFAAEDWVWLLRGLSLVIVALGLRKFMGSLSKAVKNSRFDLQNMRYEVPLELLDTVAVDLDPGKPMSLKVDFSPSDSPPFVSGSEFGKTRFTHPWLELSGSTADSHRFKLAITRNGSFETVRKTKRIVRKVRYKDSVTLAIRPPAGAVVNDAVIEAPKFDRLQAVTGKVGPTGAVLKAKGLACRGGVTWSEYSLRGSDLVVLLIAGFRALRR